MKSFISEILNDILTAHDSFEECVFILPSQRAGIFLRNELKKKLTQGFLPQIVTIEHFIENISGIQKGDTIQLLFYFYKIYDNNLIKAIQTFIRAFIRNIPLNLRAIHRNHIKIQ